MRGILLDEDGDVHLSTENAKSWAELLLDIFGDMRWVLRYIPTKAWLDAQSDTKNPNAPTVVEIVKLRKAIISLSALIDTGIVGALVCSELLEQFDSNSKYVPGKPIYKTL